MTLSESDLKDVRTVVDFIVGWWPGLEDAISWPENDDDPRLQAAKRLAARLRS